MAPQSMSVLVCGLLEGYRYQSFHPGSILALPVSSALYRSTKIFVETLKSVGLIVQELVSFMLCFSVDRLILLVGEGNFPEFLHDAYLCYENLSPAIETTILSVGFPRHPFTL